jgi:hypothetical protein
MRQPGVDVQSWLSQSGLYLFRENIACGPYDGNAI